VENAHGEWAAHASTLSQQTYGYDEAGRLRKVEDTYAGSCTTRVYSLDADANRTSTATFAPGAGGVCQVATTPGTKTASYDAAARAISTGYVYDALGRTTTVPAADAGGTAVTAAYYANDLVRSLTQGGVTKTWALDVDQQRLRNWNDGSTTHVNHYSDDSDSPSWVAEGATAWTRNIVSATGALVATYDSTTATTTLQLANLHGDIVAVTPAVGSTGLGATFEANEFGIRRTASTRRYAWTGGSRRSSDAVGGVILMGVRLYNPVTGRFLQADPVPGGSDNAYDYAGHDSVNDFDLDGRCKTKHGSRWNPWGHVRSIRCRASNGMGHAGDAVVAAGRGLGRGLAWIGRKAWGALRWFGRGLNAVGRGLKRFGAACARGVLPGLGAGMLGYGVVNTVRSLSGTAAKVGFGGGWGIAAAVVGSCVWSGVGGLR
jgi:RHS repeat-associated protein